MLHMMAGLDIRIYLGVREHKRRGRLAGARHRFAYLG